MTVKKPNTPGTPTLNLHQYNSMLGSIWIDSSRKSAKCATCGLTIVGGTERVNFQVRRANLMKFSNGGVATTSKIRMHIQCLQDFLAEAKVPSWRDQCVDCRTPSVSQQCRLAHAGVICATCLKSDRWEMCKMCGYYARKYRMSRVVGTTHDATWEPIDYQSSPAYVCDNCMQPGRYGSEWIITKRKLSREKKKEELLEKKIEQIKQEPCLDLTDAN